jgi:1-acyl-sn-glycerol-3-phosphate acyltransferase
LDGDYFAKPKWGDGIRRGAFVEAELKQLFTAEELKELPFDEVKKRIDEALYYDEFEWLKTRPNVRYRKRTLAEGLENVLSICPKCKSKHTIKTKGHDIFCEHCGHLATLTDRYELEGDLPFTCFADWYEWQKGELLHQIEKTPDFALTSEVELRLPSLDGKTMLRHAGYGTARLDATGLTYEGTRDGEQTTLHFPIEQIYRLLFGAGEDFEIYVGQEIYYFVPEQRRAAVDFYIASALLVDARAKALVP